MTFDFYQHLIRPLLFRWNTDPEQLHAYLLQILGQLDAQATQPRVNWLANVMASTFCVQDPRLQQRLWGLLFPNPVGLAAGFDKDGSAVMAWPLLGFGFAELGTVTRHAQPGNPRPRLFRLPDDRAILNRMGFNNHGAAALAERLRQYDKIRCTAPWSQTTSQDQEYPSASWDDAPSDGGLTLSHTLRSMPIGINLGKSKVTPLEAAVEDYVDSFQLLRHLGNYFVVNVSSPNTPGLRSLQAVEHLEPILAALQAHNHDRKPLLVKIAPDLSWDEITAIVALAKTHQLAGIIATNTTTSRNRLRTQRLAATGTLVSEEDGGISGAPLRNQATAVIRFIWQQTQGTMPIVGVGGIFNADDAWEKITAGASLVQLYTGWVYGGPWVIRRILSGLLQKLEIHGLDSLSDAVGLNC